MAIEGTCTNYCTSNEDATNELCKNIVEDLINGKWSKIDYLNMWMLDGGAWCACEKCNDSGNYTYRLMMITYKLMKRIKQEISTGRLKRNIKILFPVYHETLPAPDKPLPEDYDYENCIATFFPIGRCYAHTFSDKACTETNQEFMKLLAPWTSEERRYYKGEIFIGEYYNVSSFVALMIPHMQTMKKDIPFYYNSGVRHFYYMHITDNKWGPLTLTNYQLQKMLFNPKIDVDELLREFYELYYGELRDLMQEFYKTMEITMKNMKYLKHSLYSKSGVFTLTVELWDNRPLFPSKHMKYDEVLQDSNADISLVQMLDNLRYCRKLIDKALMDSSNPLVTERIIEDEMRYSYTEDMVYFIYHMVRTRLFEEKNEIKLAKISFRKAKEYAEKLEDNTEAITKTAKWDYFDNGLMATWNEYLYRQYLEKYR
jgi:hypothetical protein